MPKNIPESVKWVLKFLNLRSTPGELNINKLRECKRKLKRPPLPPKEIKPIDGNSEYYVDDKGHRWRSTRKNKTFAWEYEGEKQCYPTLDDFKHFFIKEGIPPLKGEELLLENGKPISSLDSKLFDKRPKNNSETGYYAYYERPPIEFGLYILILERVWCELSRILSNMVYGTKTYENDGRGHESLLSYMRQIRDLYLQCWKEDEVPAEDGVTGWGVSFRGRYTMVIDSMHNEEPFPHYGMLPHALYACILDFGINHKELHQYLRQCHHCGRFEIPEKKRGRKFCSAECENKANAPTRYDDLMNKRLARTKKRNNDEPKIIKHLMKHYYIQGENGTWGYPNTKEAKIIYNKLTKRITANYDYFIKKWAEPRGYT